MKHTLLIIVICALSFGCNRRGCTDELAINYDSKSKKDDGNCIYPVDETSKDTFFISSVIAVPQQKVVLLEEFTGVYCYTCPLGHLVADSIIEDHSILDEGSAELITTRSLLKSYAATGLRTLLLA